MLLENFRLPTGRGVCFLEQPQFQWEGLACLGAQKKIWWVVWDHGSQKPGWVRNRPSAFLGFLGWGVSEPLIKGRCWSQPESSLVPTNSCLQVTAPFGPSLSPVTWAPPQRPPHSSVNLVLSLCPEVCPGASVRVPEEEGSEYLWGVFPRGLGELREIAKMRGRVPDESSPFSTLAFW